MWLLQCNKSKKVTMKNSRIYILFDNILIDYKNNFGTNFEVKLVKDLKRYLNDLAKANEIMLITKQPEEVKLWFLENNLYQFIYNISIPQL